VTEHDADPAPLLALPEKLPSVHGLPLSVPPVVVNATDPCG
jgi:hypothetical protein